MEKIIAFCLENTIPLSKLCAKVTSDGLIIDEPDVDKYYVFTTNKALVSF